MNLLQFTNNMHVLTVKYRKLAKKNYSSHRNPFMRPPWRRCSLTSIGKTFFSFQSFFQLNFCHNNNNNVDIFLSNKNSFDRQQKCHTTSFIVNRSKSKAHRQSSASATENVGVTKFLGDESRR